MTNRETYSRLQVIRDRLNRFDSIIREIQQERELIIDEIVLIEDSLRDEG